MAKGGWRETWVLISHLGRHLSSSSCLPQCKLVVVVWFRAFIRCPSSLDPAIHSSRTNVVFSLLLSLCGRLSLSSFSPTISLLIWTIYSADTCAKTLISLRCLRKQNLFSRRKWRNVRSWNVRKAN